LRSTAIDADSAVVVLRTQHAPSRGTTVQRSPSGAANRTPSA
jgi:hypothetical protein